MDTVDDHWLGASLGSPDWFADNGGDRFIGPNWYITVTVHQANPQILGNAVCPHERVVWRYVAVFQQCRSRQLTRRHPAQTVTTQPAETAPLLTKRNHNGVIKPTR